MFRLPTIAVVTLILNLRLSFSNLGIVCKRYLLSVWRRLDCASGSAQYDAEKRGRFAQEYNARRGLAQDEKYYMQLLLSSLPKIAIRNRAENRRPTLKRAGRLRENIIKTQ